MIFVAKKQTKQLSAKQGPKEMEIVDFLQIFFVRSKIEKENGPNFSFIEIFV